MIYCNVILPHGVIRKFDYDDSRNNLQSAYKELSGLLSEPEWERTALQLESTSAIYIRKNQQLIVTDTENGYSGVGTVPENMMIQASVYTMFEEILRDMDVKELYHRANEDFRHLFYILP